jgi:hypothetical protein
MTAEQMLAALRADGWAVEESAFGRETVVELGKDDRWCVGSGLTREGAYRSACVLAGLIDATGRPKAAECPKA